MEHPLGSASTGSKGGCCSTPAWGWGRTQPVGVPTHQLRHGAAPARPSACFVSRLVFCSLGSFPACLSAPAPAGRVPRAWQAGCRSRTACPARLPGKLSWDRSPDALHRRLGAESRWPYGPSAAELLAPEGYWQAAAAQPWKSRSVSVASARTAELAQFREPKARRANCAHPS